VQKPNPQNSCHRRRAGGNRALRAEVQPEQEQRCGAVERGEHCARGSVVWEWSMQQSRRTVEHDDLVRRVNVERVVERERALVVRQRCVRARVVPGFRQHAAHPARP
jgi:hypothetical protein